MYTVPRTPSPYETSIKLGQEVDLVRHENALLRADNARLTAELEQARRERDLAIAHDTQPYPTAHAYETVCAALNRRTAELDALREKVREWVAALADEDWRQGADKNDLSNLVAEMREAVRDE